MSWPLIEIIEEQREEESSMTYGEERARREARMAEMIAATGYERGDSRSPIFGEQIMGIWAGESNPQRVGRYVETRRRTGRLNPGVWYRLTDGRGSFWEYEASQTLFVPVQSTQKTLEIPDFLRNQDNLRAERAAQETEVLFRVPGTNSGHGHVWPRPDGLVAKCGGPEICKQCSDDQAESDRVKAPETRPAHSAAHDCACADCVKAETPAAPTEHAVYGGRIMTLRECMEAEETPPARRQPDYSKGPITHDCTGADCTDESHSLNR